MTPKERLEADPGNADYPNKMAWAHKYKRSSAHSQTFRKVYGDIEEIITDEYDKPRSTWDSIGDTLDRILDRMRLDILRPQLDEETKAMMKYNLK